MPIVSRAVRTAAFSGLTAAIVDVEDRCTDAQAKSLYDAAKRCFELTA